MSFSRNPEPPEAGLLEVGIVVKPHGLGGEVAVHMLSDRAERVIPGAVYELSSGRVEIVESRRHQDRWLIRFDGCDSKESAERYRGEVLWAPPLHDPDELWVHELVGSMVVESDGTERGEVVSVQQNPASDLLVLESGKLVPVVFVTDGPTDGRVTVDVPDGLFDI